MQRLYIYVDKEATPENKRPKLRLSLIKQEEGQEKGEFINIGAFWPARNGSGFTGQTQDGVKIIVDDVAVPTQTEEKKEELADDGWGI
jgi:hypothetical protein